MKKSILSAIAIVCMSGTLHAQVYITEFFYQGHYFTAGEAPPGTIGNQHEFFELTNVGTTPVDVSGWYYRDNDNVDPVIPFSLSSFGSIAPGESVIITDISEQDFRLVWTSLDAGVRVLGNSLPGLSRNDTIRIFNAEGGIVDQLAYGDQDFSGTPRFRGTTAITSPANLGTNNIQGWVFSDNPAGWHDGIGMTNLTSANGDIANPGYTNFSVVPEPSAIAMMSLAFGAGALFQLRRRARQA